jgi:hypothetical protein
MNRSDFVLAALATSRGHVWTPVQLQKFFFLLDRKLGAQVGGPFFDFEPYDYGPFDAGVYHQLDALEREGRAQVDRPSFGMKTYRLTDTGQGRGEASLAELPGPVRDYVRALGDWVCSLTFAQLVTAIYGAFPEMKARSVFREQ